MTISLAAWPTFDQLSCIFEIIEGGVAPSALKWALRFTGRDGRSSMTSQASV